MRVKHIVMLTVLLLILAAGGAGWWLSNNLNGIVKNAIETYGSEMTQAKVTVDAVNISPKDGTGVIQNLRIANPQGFKTSHALQVAKIAVKVDLTTLTQAVIVIPEISIEAPDVIYEKGDSVTNFDVLMRNITASIGDTAKEGSSGNEKKLIVDSFTLRGAKARASAAILNGKTLDIDLPDIHLKNVGRAQGGVTASELGGIVANAIRSRLTASFSFDRLLQSGGQALDKAGSAIKNLFGK